MQATIQIGAHLADRRLNANARPFAQSSAAWFRLAVVYLLVGAVLGVAIGASENFELRSVHSHVSLLGWTTVALAELIYRAFPEAGASRLARVHFWLYNLAVPPMKRLGIPDVFAKNYGSQDDLMEIYGLQPKQPYQRLRLPSAGCRSKIA